MFQTSNWSGLVPGSSWVADPGVRIADEHRSLDMCYQPAQGLKPRASGSLVVKVEIRPELTALEGHVVSDELHDEHVVSCIVNYGLDINVPSRRKYSEGGSFQVRLVFDRDAVARRNPRRSPAKLDRAA